MKKTAIAELIAINNRNIKRLKELPYKENNFYIGMLTYAQAFNLDLQHFKKLEKEIIEDVYNNAYQNKKPLDLTQGCENPYCDNGKIKMYGQYLDCPICENK
jgi:hypothetical protein